MPFASHALVRSALTLAIAAGAALPAAAQTALEIPSPSPAARVEQHVGVTRFAVEYNSPGVKGRQLWGGLIPYDQLWRTGANEATRFTASRDFVFGGTRVPAGTYSVFTIPGRKTWTVVLNTNTRVWGVRGYDEKNDVARVTVNPETLPASRERLTFLFSDVTQSTARLDLEWEKVRVRVPIEVDTPAHTLASIEGALKDAWRPHYASARYLLENNGNMEQALAYANTSIGIRANWSNHWIKAQIEERLGRRADAISTAQRAQELGKGEPIFEGFYKEAVEHAIAEWQK